MSYATEVLADSPSLYWRLGEAVGTVAVDTSGNGRAGEFKNAPALNQPGGLAGDTDGAVGLTAASNHRVDSAFNPFVAGQSLTLECWAYLVPNATNNRLIGSNGANRCSVSLTTGAAPLKVNFTADSVAGGTQEWAGAWPAAEVWVHCVMVFDNLANTVELFINGTSQGAREASKDFGATPGTLQAGSAGAVPWNGRIDEVAVYASALPARRIRAHYETGIEGQTRTRNSTKPPLELDVEVEDPDGNLYRWDPTSKLASKRPQRLNFSTQRGEGAGPGGATLTRQVMKDYPDLGLLNTIRFIGKNSEVAYEGLIHDFARSNDPMQQFAVTSIGWMATARLRKFREIYADRSLANWSGMSTTRRANVYSGGFNADAASMSVGPDDAGRPSLTSSTTGKITKPFFEFTYDGLGAKIAILYIGAIARINLLDHGADAWTNLYPFGADDLAHAAEVLGGDISALSSYEFTPSSPKAVVGLTGHYDNPAATGSEGAQYGFRIERPAAFGPHGLPLYGDAPEQGPVVSDILAHIFNNFTPLTWDPDNPDTTYPVQQARFSGDYPIDAAKGLNDLHLWELGVFADRKVSYRPADLTTYDWQVRTDDPGVRFNPLQGDSIDGFANGVEVTFTDFAGRTITLFPDDFAELRDESETNPANRWGIPLWKDFTAPYPTTLADALQMGRAYLAEYNRPKSPGTITVAGGYIRDAAGHWRQGWAVQCGQTIALTNHPNDAPRLITSTPSWDQDSKQLTISVDNGYQLLQAFLARQAVAREAANLT